MRRGPPDRRRPNLVLWLQLHRRVIHQAVVSRLGVGAMQPPRQGGQRYWRSDDAQRSVSRLGDGCVPLQPDRADARHSLDLKCDRGGHGTDHGLIGVGAQLDSGHPAVITTFHAEAADTGHLPTMKPAGQHRPHHTLLLIKAGRPQRLLIITDTTLEVARRAAPLHGMAEPDGNQARPMGRTGRTGPSSSTSRKACRRAAKLIRCRTVSLASRIVPVGPSAGVTVAVSGGWARSDSTRSQTAHEPRNHQNSPPIQATRSSTHPLHH